MVNAHIYSFELYVHHVWQSQRCLECGHLQTAVFPSSRPLADPYCQCAYCSEMATEPVSPRFEFPMRRGESVYAAARRMGLDV